MPGVNVHPRARPEQPAECEQCAGAAADGRGDRRTGYAELRKWTESKDQTRTERDVDGVRQPEYAHGDRRVARSAEDRVDQKQQEHRCIAAEHHSCVARADRNDLGRRAHGRQQRRRERRTDNAEAERQDETENDRLRGGTRDAVVITLPGSSGDHC
jgi:hypothetical protein